MLYNKIISQDTKKNTITVKGYMPKDAVVRVKEVEADKVEHKINDNLADAGKPVDLKIAYDIKLVVNEKEYEPEDFDENVAVSITGFKENKVKLWHLKKDNTVEKIDSEDAKFQTNSFSIYGIEIVEEQGETSSEGQTNTQNNENTTNTNNKGDEGGNGQNTSQTPKRAAKAPGAKSGTPFTIDDYDADHSYYIGKNFTDNANGANSETYTNSNLANVTVNYHGYANGETDPNKVGRISVTETQDQVQQTKCLPITNGQVTFELMDNPFMDKPGGYGFGGWTSSDVIGYCGLLGMRYNLNGYGKVLTTSIEANTELDINAELSIELGF